MVTMVTLITDATPTSKRIATAYILAARTGCHWRTALRALEHGPAVIRTASIREALEREIAALAAEREVAAQ